MQTFFREHQVSSYFYLSGAAEELKYVNIFLLELQKNVCCDGKCLHSHKYADYIFIFQCIHARRSQRLSFFFIVKVMQHFRCVFKVAFVSYICKNMLINSIHEL